MNSDQESKLRAVECLEKGFSEAIKVVGAKEALSILFEFQKCLSYYKRSLEENNE